MTSLVGHGAEVTCVQWCPVGDTKVSVRIHCPMTDCKCACGPLVAR